MRNRRGVRFDKNILVAQNLREYTTDACIKIHNSHSHFIEQFLIKISDCMRKFIPYPLSKSQQYFFNHGKWEKSSQSATMEERNGLRLSAATAGLHYTLGGERESWFSKE